MGNNSPLKHGGNKPIQTDFTSFKKKSIQQVVAQSELEQHLNQQQAKQKQLQRYKYYEDFDRVSLQAQHRVASQQIRKQNMIVTCAITTIFLTGVYNNRFYRGQVAFSLYKRYYIPIFLVTYSFVLLQFGNSQINQVINDKYFGQTNNHLKKFRTLDQYMDLYKYVDDIKYNFDYSRSNIIKTRQQFHKGYLAYMEQQIPRIVASMQGKSIYDEIQQ